MSFFRRRFRACLCSCLFVAAAVAASGAASAAGGYFDRMYGYQTTADQQPDRIDMMLDGFLVRPAMLAYTLVSTAGVVVTLPFTAIAGDTPEAADRLVARPVRYTFLRPLGDMNDPRPRRPAPPEQDLTPASLEQDLTPAFLEQDLDGAP